MNFPSVANFSLAKGNTGLNYNTFNAPTTVVGSAYTTRASARPHQLSNGWLVSVVYDYSNSAAYTLRFYVSKDNGTTWNQLCSKNAGSATIQGFSMASKGTYVYCLYTLSGGTSWLLQFDASTITNTDLTGSSIVQLESGQTSMGAVSLAYNSSDNTLHGAWSSENSTYSSNFNIRYAKGTINGDNSVTWGAVEQVTAQNSYYYQNPSIVIDSSGTPCIFAESSITASSGTGYSANYSIAILKRNRTLVYTGAGVNANWSWGNAYPAGSASYAQYSPSAIFVPQSINGLANGRIWVAWHGYNSTNTSQASLFSSYSDDGGSTWSSATVLLQGTSSPTVSSSYASITASKNGTIAVLFVYANNGTRDIGMVQNTNGTWGSVTDLVDRSDTSSSFVPYVSTLYDTTLSFTIPSFIYMEEMPTSSVQFKSDYTLQQIPTPPEMYIPLWWYSGGYVYYSYQSAGGYGFGKGTGNAVATNPPQQNAKLHTLNSSWSPNLKYALEVCMWSTNSGYTTYAQLWDITSNTGVGPILATTSTTATILRTAQFTLTPGHVYGVSLWNSNNYVYACDASLIVFPS